MRKAAYIIIAIIVLMASIDFICSFGNEKTDEELFARKLNESKMLTYHDPDFGFTVRYPSFFIEQPDSLDDNVGYARFSYGNYWANFILECYATRNYDLSPKAGMDTLARMLHATQRMLGKDYFILSGPQYENDCYMDDYSFYSKYVSRGRLWYVYTMVYPDRYHDHLGKLFKEINGWQVWELPHTNISHVDSFLIYAATRDRHKKRFVLNLERPKNSAK